jgi:hypothetical protein
MSDGPAEARTQALLGLAIIERPEHPCGFGPAVANECDEAAGGERRLVDRHGRPLLEVALEPPCGDARMPARIFARVQHGQLERLGEAEPTDLLRDRLSDN